MKKNFEIDEILKKYYVDNKNTLAILHDVQFKFGYVPAECLKDIAVFLGVSIGELFSVVSFYDAFSFEQKGKITIQVCNGTVCSSNKGKEFLKELESAIGIKAGETTKDGYISLETVACLGHCEKAPVMSIDNKICSAKDYDISNIFNAKKENEYFSEANIIETSYSNVLLKKSKSIDKYIKEGGYIGLKNALNFSTRKAIITELKKSGLLRGRSGSGFPVSAKWEAAYNAPGRDGNRKDKFIIANGDEGDSGAFMDKWIMEENPYAVLEGMAIGAIAIGAEKGYVYIRDEYPNAIDRMENAIAEAKENNLLGENILNSGILFDCEIVRGAGSYVCGEESALMESIEGKPGNTRKRIPLPTIRGVDRQPTVINNIETLANVPLILRDGGEEYSKSGVKNCTGTKIFSLSGKIKNKGLVELPMGAVSIRELIFDIGGGMETEKEFNYIQIGGPLGGFISKENLDLTLDFDSIKESGAMLGSGGIIVFDESDNIVETTKDIIDFLALESCGTCTPCREGLRCIKEIYKRLIEREAVKEDLKLLEDLVYAAKIAAKCSFGKSICTPVLTGMRAFKESYEACLRK